MENKSKEISKWLLKHKHDKHDREFIQEVKGFLNKYQLNISTLGDIFQISDVVPF